MTRLTIHAASAAAVTFDTGGQRSTVTAADVRFYLREWEAMYAPTLRLGHSDVNGDDLRKLLAATTAALELERRHVNPEQTRRDSLGFEGSSNPAQLPFSPPSRTQARHA